MENISVYVYTAWNGYSWQGCSEATASVLQRYMEAAGVLPGAADGRPPFGGAIVCQIGDRMGTAVYRCFIREHGDAFGRDCLYIALAFLPCSGTPVDFSKLLQCREMSAPAPGQLAEMQIDASALRLDGGGASGAGWAEQPRETSYKGLDGLADLSREFFDKKNQLGFLQASFASATGSLDDVVANLTYKVFPEVTALVKAADDFARAKDSLSGVVPDNHGARVALREALKLLGENRSSRMKDYHGLAEYIRCKAAQIDDSAGRVEKIRVVTERLEGAIRDLNGLRVDCRNWPADKVLSGINVDGGVSLRRYDELLDEARDIPYAEGDGYRKALDLAFRLQEMLAAKKASLKMAASWFAAAKEDCRTAFLKHVEKWAAFPEAAIFDDLSGWAKTTRMKGEAAEQKPVQPHSVANAGYELRQRKSSGSFFDKLLWVMILVLTAAIAVLGVWFAVKGLQPAEDVKRFPQSAVEPRETENADPAPASKVQTGAETKPKTEAAQKTEAEPANATAEAEVEVVASVQTNAQVEAEAAVAAQTNVLGKAEAAVPAQTNALDGAENAGPAQTNVLDKAETGGGTAP